MIGEAIATEAQRAAGRPGLAPAARWAPAVLLAATFLAMLAFSWGKWPDVLVDFGHELYVPWQLAAGKMLGRDINWAVATGPLSPYWNALLFRAFGVAAWTLFAANLVVLAALTFVLCRLLRALYDPLAATAACILFLAVFAFGQYVGIGNYNYVAPYSHGATHGLLLSLAGIALLRRAARTGAPRDLAATASCAGLVFLTKPEIFVAQAGAVGIGLLLLLRAAPALRARARLLAAGTLPALGPPAIALALLFLQGGSHDAIEAAFGPWLTLASPMRQSPFYVHGMGLDDPAGNLAVGLTWLGAGAMVLAAVALVDWRLRSRGAQLAGAVGLGGAAAALALLAVPAETWMHVGRPLPLIALAGFTASAAHAWGRPLPGDSEAVARVALWTFALLLLLKMAFNARLYHYGFALAMPATLLVAASLVSSVPRFLRSRGGAGIAFQAVAIALLVGVAVAHVRVAASVYEGKTVRVGAGRDAFYADGRGRFVNAILDALARRAPGGPTLAVIPEGVMMNYLARRENPSPYLTYLPEMIARRGEGALLEPYRRSPPDHVVVVSRDASEFGAALFGLDYGLETARWLSENYRPLGTVGSSPFERQGYGMMLLERSGGGP